MKTINARSLLQKRLDWKVIAAGICATLCGAIETPCAEARDVGLGVIFGEPTGLTGKFWVDRHGAIDAGLAFSFNDFFLVYGDYLYHFPGAFAAGRSGKGGNFASQLTPYLGGGAILFVSTESNRKDDKFYTSDGTVGLGIRIPFGIEWTPSNPPIGVFLELAPGVGIIPSTFGFLEGGVGIRYYFG